jgi:hypothetical protein
MPYEDLFFWWAIAITWSSMFLIAIGIYLYVASRKRNNLIANRARLGTNLVFVWVLLGLLVLYLVSIDLGSAPLFAAGNILVEAILVGYILKRRPDAEQMQSS